MAKSFSLILSAPDTDPVQYRLTGERVGIGRSEENRIVLDVKAISSRHGRLVKSDSGGYRIVDLGSTNGTRVNGQRVMDPAGVALKHGDRILLGETVEGQFLEVVDGNSVRLPKRSNPAAHPVMVSASEIESDQPWIPMPNWLDPSAGDSDEDEAINPVAAAVARQAGGGVGWRES